MRPLQTYAVSSNVFFVVVSPQDLMRQSTEVSEEQVRKSMGGVGDFLQMEESDESPAARDTVTLLEQLSC